MADVTKIIDVSITRETSFPSSDSFGVGGIIAEFTPGNLNTPMLGATGRYKKYTSLKSLEQDGWTENDLVYLAARTYYYGKKHPRNFIVGLRKSTDDNWAATLNAIKAENNEWYGFSVILNSTELSTATNFYNAIKAVADWTETQKKLFIFSTSQGGAIGELILLTSGTFTSGKPGALSAFQAVTNGQFKISKDSAAAVVVKDINLTAAATAGEFETGNVYGNLSNLQAVDDGEVAITLDGGAAINVTGVDLTGVTSYANLAEVLEAAIQATVGLELVTVRYSSSVKKFVFVSGTTGATSSISLATVAVPAGTDLTGVNYLNGGVSEPGSAAASVASYADVATSLQAAIVAAGVAGVTVAYDTVALRFVFTSGTTGNNSAVVISTVTDQDGDDLTASTLLNGGVAVYGTDAGTIPGTDDIGTLLKGNYDRTGWMYHEKARDANKIDSGDINWIEFAWMSMMFAYYDPAEATWAFKSFTENPYIEVSTISDDQDEFARGNNGNTYTLTGGTPVTLDGKVCGGEYFDIMRGTDWFQAKLVEEAYRPMTENPKLPFTDGGIGLQENAIRGAFTAAEVNLLDAAYTVLTIPTVDSISKTDKAARNATGFEFTGRYQGAIQKVGITGTIGL